MGRHLVRSAVVVGVDVDEPWTRLNGCDELFEKAKQRTRDSRAPSTRLIEVTRKEACKARHELLFMARLKLVLNFQSTSQEVPSLKLYTRLLA